LLLTVVAAALIVGAVAPLIATRATVAATAGLVGEAGKQLVDRLSNTMADWVCSTRPPSLRFVSEPPGLKPMYLPPSNPWVWMLAKLSSGIWLYCLSIRNVTTALNDLGSKRIPLTSPTRTPAIVTGEPTFRSPMLSNSAVTWYPDFEPPSYTPLLGNWVVRKNSAAKPSRTNIPVPISSVRLARMAIGSLFGSIGK